VRRLVAGFTLIELLISMAIMLLVLGAVLAFFVQSQRVYRVQEQVSDRQAAADSAIQLMTYEIGLAGYKGTGENDPIKPFAGGSTTLRIDRGPDSASPDTITVRYFEDRFVSSSQELVVAYSVDTTVQTLMRSEASSAPQELVDGVLNLKVVQFIRRDGVRVDLTTTGGSVPENLAALNVELTLASGRTWRFPIAIVNAQQAVLN